MNSVSWMLPLLQIIEFFKLSSPLEQRNNSMLPCVGHISLCSALSAFGHSAECVRCQPLTPWPHSDLIPLNLIGEGSHRSQPLFVVTQFF